MSPSHQAAKAKLILIKGEGFESISYQLGAKEHKIGRLHGTIIFPEDRYLSPLHANLFYDQGGLFLRDEGSTNGVFLKVRGAIGLQDGDAFLTGEQLMRFHHSPLYEALSLPAKAGQEDTQFYGCPAEAAIAFRLTHHFRTGREGAVLYATTPNLTIGREQCDLSFPFDRHISGRHAKVSLEGGKPVLQDLGSKNGTFIRLTAPHRLDHQDCFFVGQQLMRVELSH